MKSINEIRHNVKGVGLSSFEILGKSGVEKVSSMYSIDFDVFGYEKA